MKLKPLLLSLLGLLATPFLPAAVTLDVENADPFEIPGEEKEGAYQRAYREFKEGNFAKAEAFAQEAVDSGTPAGYFILGWLHEKGLGRPVDFDAALQYYRKGHEEGFSMTSLRTGILLVNSTGPDQEAHRTEGRKILAAINSESAPLAQLILGKSHALGFFSEEPDFETALAHLNRSIKDGNQEALIFKAGLLEGQHNYPKTDHSASIAAYEQAAALGNQEAIIAAGTRRLSGPEAIRDEKKGLKWLGDLADQGDALANYYLGNHYAVVRKDYGKAIAYLTTSAEKDTPQAHYLLGLLHQSGMGTPVSEEKAIERYEKAAKFGHLQAAHNLARIFLAQEDKNTRHLNIKKGYQYLAYAASQLPDAQAELGVLYLSGQLGAKDLTAAAAWLEKAARAGQATAQNNLAALYESGNGVPQNLTNAWNLYSLSANQGHLSAMTALGRLTATGQGTEKNIPLAWAYFSLAAERKDEAASRLLSQLTPLLSEEQLAEAKNALLGLKSPKKAKK